MKIQSKATLLRSMWGWALLLGLIASMIIWLVSRDPGSRDLVLVTGHEGGLYHRFGEELKAIYERRTGKTMVVHASPGSRANQTALREEDAEIAILQAGSIDLEGVDLFCALYPEVVHLIVRRDLPVHRVEELEGRRLLLGSLESGMRRSALELLGQYQLSDRILEVTNRYFSALMSDPELEGAVVTTGILNPDLQELLATQDFRLLPVDLGGAIEARNACLAQYMLPKGVYGIRQNVPPEDLPTVATTALLVGRKNLPPRVVRDLLGAVYEGGLHYRFPTLFQKDESSQYSPGPLSEEAELFFHPADRIGEMANIMESIAAFKELAFALFAGVYLLWGRFRRLEEREKSRFVQEEKDQLDELLTETLEIEEAQLEVSDPVRLQAMMDEVTEIKLRALRQLTHEDLRGDRVFQIFLTQCANLMHKLQAKIHFQSTADPDVADSRD